MHPCRSDATTPCIRKIDPKIHCAIGTPIMEIGEQARRKQEEFRCGRLLLTNRSNHQALTSFKLAGCKGNRKL